MIFTPAQNHYYIEGMATYAEPHTPRERVIHRALNAIENASDLTGNELTVVEEELRRAIDTAVQLYLHGVTV